MRIWSLHPKYLDQKGIVALWREALLARKVLEGKTRGYIHHPQLQRFTESGVALEAINQYLAAVYTEALERGYNFDRTKVKPEFNPLTLDVTDGQIRYEFDHLLKKLKQRDPERFQYLKKMRHVDSHPLFIVRQGEIEAWEMIQ